MTGGTDVAAAIAWCVAVTADGYLWARKPFSRDSVQA